MYLVKTPRFLKKLYPDLVWDFKTNSQSVYLSFDDGPVPESTPWVLDLLKKYQIKATFFCIGANVQKHPALYQRVIEEGHRIGNHTQTHVSGWQTKDQTYMAEIESAAQSISSNLFRPPYGRIRRSQTKAIKDKYKIIMWDVISGDFDTNISADDCYYNVTKNVEQGSILVFHDSVKAKPRLHGSLERIIDYLLENGYQLDVIPETI